MIPEGSFMCAVQLAASWDRIPLAGPAALGGGLEFAAGEWDARHCCGAQATIAAASSGNRKSAATAASAAWETAST